jgi:hypothetical protein
MADVSAKRLIPELVALAEAERGPDPLIIARADSLTAFLRVAAATGKDSRGASSATYYRRVHLLQRVGVAPITSAEGLADLARTLKIKSRRGLVNLCWVLNSDKSRTHQRAEQRWSSLVTEALALLHVESRAADQD